MARMGGPSSSKPRLSLTEADNPERLGHTLTIPQGQSLVQVLPTSPNLCNLLVLLSSLPPELSRLILSWVSLEKLMEWCFVSKKWKALLLSGGLSVYGHDVQPSTRNRSPIAIIFKLKLYVDRRITQSTKRYHGRLHIWQDAGMEYPFKIDFHTGFESLFSSGGLLYLKKREHYDALIRNSIDVWNPVTQEYRRLEVPLPAEVHGGQLRWDHRKALLWGIIVEKQPDRCKVIVQVMTNLANWEDSGDSAIKHILVYNSASGLWEMGGTLSSEISRRVENHIYSSTSSRGNLYFLTIRYFATASERKTPRLIEYDAQRKGCREISPLPPSFGYGQPVLVEHLGDIIFVTRHRKKKKGSRERYLWVFFRLDVTSNLWVRMREMPEDVSEQLRERMKTVRCHGNGDFINFYGEGKLCRSNPSTVSILVHDFAENSWAWLPDLSTQGQLFCQLLSFQPSLIKV